ncbi:MAG TPA: lipid-A-disaccharide synthase, partial [Elusimicrobiota bacterium]|nr:lipid-A-disaccharide synthase [Elusimicrobiota bacterium]
MPIAAEARRPHILIVAGDPSGDERAAALAEALRLRLPALRLTALGGAHLAKVVDTLAYPLVDVGGFGFAELATKLPRLWAAWRTVQARLREDPPDLVVPVDYYGFNIHVARAAHQRRIPVVYYISPQVWASRPHRVHHLAKVISKMLVIFPFEVDLYRRAAVPVVWVGHPLRDRMPAPREEASPPVVGLFPGSRRGTVMRHLPLLVETARRLRTQFPSCRFQLFRPLELPEELYRASLADDPWIELLYDPNYDQRPKLCVAITVSGTASLENMLLGIPMVIMYRLPALTYQIAKRLIRVPFVGIPNLLAGRAVV